MRPTPQLPSTVKALASMLGNVVKARVCGERALLSPLFVSWEINSACNLRCPYCYLHARSYGFSDRGLDLERIRTVLARIQAVTQDVVLLGGEPYIHPDWDAIVDHAVGLGLRVRCITNGTRLRRHMETTGRLQLLIVSYDHKRYKAYTEQMDDMLEQLAEVRATHPHVPILMNFVLCSDDEPAWVVERIEALTDAGYNVFANVDRYFGGGRVHPSTVAALKRVKQASGRVHMTDETLDWLEDSSRPVPFCSPTLLPLLDSQARLIYPCCYYNEQSAGTLVDTDYRTLLRQSARRYGSYPFDKCSTCTTTAYLDASVAVRRPTSGLRHYHRLYNRSIERRP